MDDIRITEIRRCEDLPSWLDREQLARFFHEVMRPYHDELPDVERALDYAFLPGAGQGGFALLAARGEQLIGALLTLKTGMSGFQPPYILLFVGVESSMRNRGVGTGLVRRALALCGGNMKLHVQYDNPARRMYEREGFYSKQAEMRHAP